LESHLATFNKLQPALVFLQMMEINETLASQGLECALVQASPSK
jgi:hypothetical protein